MLIRQLYIKIILGYLRRIDLLIIKDPGIGLVLDLEIQGLIIIEMKIL
jgi:hypothetical protein